MMHVFLSDKAYVSLLAEVSEHPGIETGGVFLGYIDEQTCRIVETIDPGPCSTHEELYFEYDRDYCTWLANKTARLYRSGPTLVGLWHRHPGSFDRFSQLDMATNRVFAQLSHYGAVSLLVNVDPKPRLSAFHVSSNACERVKVTVGDENFAPRLLELKVSRQLEGLVARRERHTLPSDNASGRTEVPEASRSVPCMRRLLDELSKTLVRIPASQRPDCMPTTQGKDDDIDRLVATFGDDLVDLANALGGAYSLSYREGALYICAQGAEPGAPTDPAPLRLFLDGDSRPVMELDSIPYRCTAGFVRRAMGAQTA